MLLDADESGRELDAEWEQQRIEGLYVCLFLLYLVEVVNTPAPLGSHPSPPSPITTSLPGAHTSLSCLLFTPTWECAQTKCASPLSAFLFIYILPPGFWISILALFSIIIVLLPILPLFLHIHPLSCIFGRFSDNFWRFRDGFFGCKNKHLGEKVLPCSENQFGAKCPF